MTDQGLAVAGITPATEAKLEDASDSGPVPDSRPYVGDATAILRDELGSLDTKLASLEEEIVKIQERRGKVLSAIEVLEDL